MALELFDKWNESRAGSLVLTALILIGALEATKALSRLLTGDAD